MGELNSSKKLIHALRALLGQGRVSLHDPIVSRETLNTYRLALDDGFFSSVSPSVSDFEEELRKRTGAYKVVATTSGTSAISTALIASGLRPGDHVLVPNLTFAATAHAVIHVGGIPVLVDSQVDDPGMSLESAIRVITLNYFETPSGWISKVDGQRLMGALFVHVLGRPSDLSNFYDYFKTHKLTLIEDAAAGLGSFVRGKHVGLQSDLGILSFNANKVLTTGSGGAVLVPTEDKLERVIRETGTGKLPHPTEFVHNYPGRNIRLSGLQASFGLSQLPGFSNFLNQKAKLEDAYREILADFDLALIDAEPNHIWNRWLISARLGGSWQESASEVSGALTQAGIQARPLWQPLARNVHLAEFGQSEAHHSEEWYRRIVSLPSGHEAISSALRQKI